METDSRKIDEHIETLKSIRDYLCAGNPIYDVERVRTAIDCAIEALKKY